MAIDIETHKHTPWLHHFLVIYLNIQTVRWIHFNEFQFELIQWRCEIASWDRHYIAGAELMQDARHGLP